MRYSEQIIKKIERIESDLTKMKYFDKEGDLVNSAEMLKLVKQNLQEVKSLVQRTQ